MKVLMDQCVPKPKTVKQFLASNGHEARSVYDAGLAGKTNGILLAAVNDAFDVLLTVDKNLRYQQNMTGKHIAIIVICARSNRTQDVHRRLQAALKALASIKPGQVRQVGDIGSI